MTERGSVSHPRLYKSHCWTGLLFQSAIHFPAEVLHPHLPSMFACFSYCSLIVSEFVWEGVGIDIQCPSKDIGNEPEL